jgi:hypothetical protein
MVLKTALNTAFLMVSYRPSGRRRDSPSRRPRDGPRDAFRDGLKTTSKRPRDGPRGRFERPLDELHSRRARARGPWPRATPRRRQEGQRRLVVV